MSRSRIYGTGQALPKRVLTNHDLEKMVDTNDAWIVERTGIRERRILDPGLAASDLAAQAARNACDAAGWDPASLDCVIVATVTADSPLPSTAVHVQRALRCQGGAAFDLAAACAGFIYGLSVADGLVRTGQFRRVAVVGVEVLSRIINWKDRNTCVLFGDGAGAAVIGPADPAEDRGVLSTHIYADGSGAEYLQIPAGGSRMPATPETVASGLHFVHMDGKKVFAHAVRNMSAACETALDVNGLGPADVDLVVAHQANLRIIEAVSERCSLPLSKFHLNIERYGNTSSASVPIALDEAVRGGRLQPGDHVLLCALGAGFAWGSALLRW